MPASKRVNKTKEEIAKELAHKIKIEREKGIARRIFPLLTDQESIYDAQTTVNALSGYIKYEMSKKEASFKLNDLLIDLSKEPDTKITATMQALKVELQEDGAKEVASLLERLGQALGQFSASQFMQKPMSEIKMEDIIS